MLPTPAMAVLVGPEWLHEAKLDGFRAQIRVRKCHGLTYSSQYEPSYQRAIDQADKLRGASDEEPFPPKPKGMHWRTYDRLAARYNDLMISWTVGITTIWS
jgi:hypothetical protein